MTDMCDMDSGWVPVTPGGTVCTWIAAETEDEAWKLLMANAIHMPYPNKAAFIARGYEVCEFTDPQERECPLCGEMFDKDFGDLLRKDNATLICSACGTKEAMEGLL